MSENNFFSSNMKKHLGVIIALVIVILGIGAFIFYWQNLRGIAPAFENSTQDITQLIPSSRQQSSSQEEQITSTQQSTNTTNMPLQLPAGFSISIFAKNLVNPRVLIKDPNGVLLTSVTSEGKIVALPDTNHDGVADSNITVAAGLTQPHGLAFRCPDPNNARTCELYIGESNKVTRYLYDAKNLKAAFSKKIVDLPGTGEHFTRTLLFLNDQENKLLVAMGSDCNVCHESDSLRASIQVLNVDTEEMTPYATGLRNSVFMTHDTFFGKVYATEMGRDLLGDDIPPDEINLIEEGKNYGWPNCYGQNVHDNEFDHNTYIRNPCMAPFETPAVLDLQAHSAPLGLAFFPTQDSVDGQKNLWPQEYKGNLLVSFHGSWNRSIPTGYKVVLINTTADATTQTTTLSKPADFITGWLGKDAKTSLGRPAGILIEPNATLYISDDKAGVVYLLTYGSS